LGRNGVLGIIVPISEDEVMHDVFHGKSVHVTLSQGESTDLEKGDRILFYDSGMSHNIMGEAVISEIEFENAENARHNHQGKLCLDGPRFESYLSSLPGGDASIMRVLHFKDATMYANPVN
jgi:hypothetical protein